MTFNAFGNVKKKRRDKKLELRGELERDMITRTLHNDLSDLLNSYSEENKSDTPDYILASYLISCLNNFNSAVNERKDWHNRGKYKDTTSTLKS